MRVFSDFRHIEHKRESLSCVPYKAVLPAHIPMVPFLLKIDQKELSQKSYKKSAGPWTSLRFEPRDQMTRESEDKKGKNFAYQLPWMGGGR